MIKLFVCIFLSVAIVSGCTNAQAVDSKRRAIINKAITAIRNYDTLALLRLIDTAYYFDIYGKESFLFKATRINKLIKECDSEFGKNQVSQKPGSLKTTEYWLVFCNQKKNSDDDLFYVSFVFPDRGKRVKIQSFDVIKNEGEITPNVPVLKQSN